jgi:hypothetical protein
VKDLHNTLQEAHTLGSFPRSMREGDNVLLYKKGDSRDPHNYRPITLLQVDYKILAKILVARMKRVVNNSVSKEQLGFVPKRLIGEATHLLKLVQAYLEEEGRDGLLLALDWESFRQSHLVILPPSPGGTAIWPRFQRVGATPL